jgi:hypothetical protein
MKWISVKDKLPELNKRVLCIFETVHPTCTGNNSIMDTFMYKRQNCNIVEFGGESAYRKVTHWMPLPELPTPLKGDITPLSGG